MSSTPIISIEPHAEVVCAIVHQAQLDELCLDQLHREVVKAADLQPALPVVLNLTHVSFVPSMGLGTFVMLMRHFKTNGRRFVLIELQPEVRKVLALTRLDKLFEIHSDLETALSHLRS